jgi:purine-binding chemotaxis protein CheW
MSAKRFRVEKDYFDKKSRFPEEIIKPKQERVMSKAQDTAVLEEHSDVPPVGIEPPPQRESNIVNENRWPAPPTQEDETPVILEKDHDTEAQDSKQKALKSGYHKYLTFQMKGQKYGLESLKVKEIIGVMKITPLPQTPDFVKGIVNLRGKVIPVIDLGVKFGMKEADYTEKTCIIVVEVTGSKGLSHIGIIVDSVSEVVNIDADQIEETPAFGVKLDTNYILGMAKMEDGITILLNIEKVLTSV